MKPFQLLFLALIALILGLSNARIYERCELARELDQYFSRSELPDWICLVQSESNFDTRAINKRNSDRSWDYGLFQINDRYWCEGNYDSFSDGSHLCGIDCNRLMYEDLSYQIPCVKRIYAMQNGFRAWEGWKAKCQGKNLPSVDDCFAKPKTNESWFRLPYIEDENYAAVAMKQALGLTHDY